MNQIEEIKENQSGDEHVSSDSDVNSDIGTEFDSENSDNEENEYENGIIWEERSPEFLQSWKPMWIKNYTEEMGPKNISSGANMQLENQTNADELTCFSKIIDQTILDHISECLNIMSFI